MFKENCCKYWMCIRTTILVCFKGWFYFFMFAFKMIILTNWDRENMYSWTDNNHEMTLLNIGKGIHPTKPPKCEKLHFIRLPEVFLEFYCLTDGWLKLSSNCCFYFRILNILIVLQLKRQVKHWLKHMHLIMTLHTERKSHSHLKNGFKVGKMLPARTCMFLVSFDYIFSLHI